MRRIIAILFLVLPLTGFAAPAHIKGVRLWAAPDNTRIVFDVDAPVQHSLFALHKPDRIVVDIDNVKLDAAMPSPTAPHSLVRAIRYARHDGKDLRVVFDLRRPVRPQSFLLQPNEKYSHRLVIDLHDAAAAKAKVITAPQDRAKGPRPVIVAIDPGHGGDDPGATGPYGDHEKDVVLKIARRLERLVKAQKGMQPLMTRDGDYYVGLRERYEKARAAKADLFISIHADAYNDRHARGATVFVLSRRGASSAAAAFVARQENASDRIGGVSLDDKGDLLKSVLVDLSQSATIEDSLLVANDVRRNLEEIGRLHFRGVQKAGFVVLKAPDVPSILVETGFITNPREEVRLRNPRYQEKIAEAIMRGIRAYFLSKPPPGTLWAATRHVIRRGETLTGIAQRYSVSLKSLRDANNLSGDKLAVGAVLRIPTSAVTMTN